MSPRLEEERLRAGLRAPADPEEHAAQQRARRLVLAAAPPPAVRRPRMPPRVLAVVVLVAAGLTAAALTPSGDAVARWVRHAVRAPAPAAPRSPAGLLDARLPGGGGRLLASSPAGPKVTDGVGVRRLLGDVDEATWSPHGRYVAATRGIELIAVDLRGVRRWSIHPSGRLLHPRWSPSGFRVAYLAQVPPGPGGWRLRVVAGDGTGDREVARPAAPVAPAWRTVRRHELAFAQTDGRVAILDTDTGRIVGRSHERLRPTALAYSGDGERLYVLSRRRTTVLTPHGTSTRFVAPPRHTFNVGLAAAPRGRTYAVARRDRSGLTRLSVVQTGHDRPLVGVPGPLRGLAFSPDGRWIALATGRSDAWMLVRAGPAGDVGQTRLLSGVLRRLGDGRFARLEGWCCSR